MPLPHVWQGAFLLVRRQRAIGAPAKRFIPQRREQIPSPRARSMVIAAEGGAAASAGFVRGAVMSSEIACFQ
jgi:hypothetical protein